MNDPQVLKQLAQVVPVKLNVDDEAVSALGQKLGLRGVPAMAFMTPDGQLVHEFTGGVNVKDFLVHLDSALAIYAEGQKKPPAPTM